MLQQAKLIEDEPGDNDQCLSGKPGLAEVRPFPGAGSATSTGIDQTLTHRIDKWFEVFNDRSCELSNRGIRYLHVNVPYLDTTAPSTNSSMESGRQTLDQLQQRYPQISDAIVNPLAYLSTQQSGYPLFWTESQLWTPWCCYMVYQLVCGKLNSNPHSQLLGYPFDETVLHDSQTTIREYRFHMRSRLRYANELATLRQNTVKEYNKAACLNRLAEGTHLVFENHHAEAIQQCVVIFGNQYCADKRVLLTGMMAETFSEVHFIWSSDIDFNYLDRVKPNIVITQGCDMDWASSPLTSQHSFELTAQTNYQLTKTELLAKSGKQRRPAEKAKQSLFHVLFARKQSEIDEVSLMEPEEYSLAPPRLVQTHGECDSPDTSMRSNNITLQRMQDVSLFFNGPSWWVHSRNGTELIRHEVPKSKRRVHRWLIRQHLPGTTLMFASSAGAHCYYHWMAELLPKLGMLERQGIALDSIDHFLVREISGQWQLETLSRFGIDQSRIVETRHRPHMTCDTLLHIHVNCGINLKMPRFIPQWMQHLYPVDQRQHSRIKLYISRPDGVRRGVSNEQALTEKLKNAGFTIQAMEGLSVAEQAALLARADVVMSPHGGALTNMFFCKPGITVVELFSRHVFPYYYGLAANCGHNYYAILENPLEDYPRLVNSKIAQSFADTQHETASLSFEVDLNAVDKLLEELQKP